MLRTWLLSMLMLDRTDQTSSYQQFLVTLREKVRQAVLVVSFPFLMPTNAPS